MPSQWVWVRKDEVELWADRYPPKKCLSIVSYKRRGKSTSPDWNCRPEWSMTKPTKKWARRCVDKWCLLAPYDTSITEKQWMAYYEERMALDKLNTMRSEESEAITPEELWQDTWDILQKASGDVAAAILGSKLDDEERKKQIAYTLLGSLYFTSLFGSDEGNDEDAPEPRTLDATTRLYSPFGIGTSVDFHYEYHFRLRIHMDNERGSTLTAVARTISDCNPKEPLKCAAAPASEDDDLQIDDSPAAFIIFEREQSFSQTIPEAKIIEYEEPLFGWMGWLSPLKIADLLLAAGTVMHYHERDIETPESFIDKLPYFPGENKGKRVLTQELARLARLEDAQDTGKDDEICIPERLLLLARDGEGDAAPPAKRRRRR